MKHKPNQASDDELRQVTLSMKQIRLLSRLCGAELDDVYYNGSDACQTTLENLSDLFFSHTHVEVSAEEQAAAFEAWAKKVVADEEARLKAMIGERA